MLGSHARDMGPDKVSGDVQVLPPSGEEMNPAYRAQLRGVAVRVRIVVVSQGEMRAGAGGGRFDG